MALTKLTKPRARWATFKLKMLHAVSRSLYDKILEQGISLKDFGAVPDGVTDNTVVIQAAIKAAEGGRLIIPEGDYYYGNNFSRDTILVNNIEIISYGRIITPRGLRLEGDNITVKGGFYGRTTKSTNPDINYECGLSVKGARAQIDGVRCGFADGAGLILNSQYATVKNCWFYDNIMGALLSAECSFVIIENNRIVNNNVNNKSGADGLNIQRNADNIHVLNNYIANSGEHGIYFQGFSSTFRGNTVTGNTGSGMKFGSHPTGQASKPVMNPVISTDGQTVQQGGFGIVVADNNCYDNGGDHIYFQPSFKFVEICNNTCWNTDPTSTSLGIKITYFSGVGETDELEELKDFKVYSNSLINCDISSECNHTLIYDNYVEGAIFLHASDGGKTGQQTAAASHDVRDNVVTKRSDGSGGRITVSRSAYPLTIKNNDMLSFATAGGGTESIILDGNLIREQGISIDFTRMRNFDRNVVHLIGDIALNRGDVSFGFSNTFRGNEVYAPDRIAGVVISASFNSASSNNGVFADNIIHVPNASRCIVVWGDNVAITGNTFESSPSTDVCIDYQSEGGTITGNTGTAGNITIRKPNGGNVVVGNGLRCSAAGNTVNVGNKV